jgi:prevent-host-death family protein
VTEVIKQSELRNDNASIMRRVAAGESFVVTVNGIPVADLVPHQRGRKRTTLPAEEVDALLRELPPVDARRWRRDQGEIDRLLGDAELGPPREDEVDR